MGVVEVGNRHAHRRDSATCHSMRRLCQKSLSIPLAELEVSLKRLMYFVVAHVLSTHLQPLPQTLSEPEKATGNLCRGLRLTTSTHRRSSKTLDECLILLSTQTSAYSR